MSCVDNMQHNTYWYALALSYGHYRAALVESIRAIRRCRKQSDRSGERVWTERARQCWRRRHES